MLNGYFPPTMENVLNKYSIFLVIIVTIDIIYFFFFFDGRSTCEYTSSSRFL